MSRMQGTCLVAGAAAAGAATSQRRQTSQHGPDGDGRRKGCPDVGDGARRVAPRQTNRRRAWEQGNLSTPTPRG